MFGESARDMGVRHHYDPAKMRAILASPSGGLAKDMAKRAIRVTNQAKKTLENGPRRVNTG